MNGRTGVICGAFIADTGRWPVQIDGNGSNSQLQIALRPCNLKPIQETAYQMKPPIHALPEFHSSAKPNADELRMGSRVLIDRLVSKPAMNGRTGVICGAFNAGTGRWTVQIDGNGSSSQLQIALRPCNIQLLPVHSLAGEDPPITTGTVPTQALFEEGQRLYGEQRFSDAAERWGRAALQQHGPSHAHLSNMLIDGRADVAKDKKRAFELASAGAELGCAHSKGVLGRCHVGGHGVPEDAARGLALGRESEAAGSCFGQYVVGVCYDFGCGGVAQDDAEAVRLYRLAAAQGLAEAQRNLGNMFENGEGVAQDYAEAVRLYRLAAEQGHAEAQKCLGNMFDNGEGVAQDYAEAARLYRLAAEQGHAEAQKCLGNMFDNGEGVAQDYAEAARLYRLAAEQGLAGAQYLLGNMFYNGEGVAQDYAEAVRLYRLAAEQGLAGAQCNLGNMFDNGEGVAQDSAEAARLYRLAAEQGHAEAQKCLGNMFDNGEGVAQDSAEAARLYRLAAEQGLSEAQYLLGNMFCNGEGVAQDSVEAARLYRLAAEQGLSEAQYLLGNMFYNGEGVAQDSAEAARLYRLAAEQGLAEAQYLLGNMFCNGEGVAQDSAEAARLYRLAAEQGHADATTAFKRLAA
jgi:hypothetical protein